jgi:pimeloyl-ACP methyl ester carboxylesterase
MQTQYTVEGGAGLALNVLEWGRRDGPAIVFIHGWSQAYPCWQKQYDSFLAEHFRLIAFDLRGHGLSAAPTDPACYQDSRLWADDLRAILTRLEVGPVVLVGWSYGSFVIGDYLRAYGAGGVAGINLVGAGVRFGEQAIGTYIGAGFTEPFVRAISRDLLLSIDAMIEFIDHCFAVKLSRRDYERVLCFNMTARADVRAAMVARAIDVETPLRDYRGPLLVSHGRKDTMVLPATAELVRELCPQAQLSWYEEAAHGPFFEVPERFNHELAAFVRAATA